MSKLIEGFSDKRVRRALQTVRDRLRHNKIHKLAFDMNVTCDAVGKGRGHPPCGTVGCIGGWLGLVLGLDHIEADELVRNYCTWEPLHDLFYPSCGVFYSHITRAQGAQAIDNFLKTGDPDWEGIVSNG